MSTAVIAGTPHESSDGKLFKLLAQAEAHYLKSAEWLASRIQLALHLDEPLARGQDIRLSLQHLITIKSSRRSVRMKPQMLSGLIEKNFNNILCFFEDF
jgi:hypothetical protein